MRRKKLLIIISLVLVLLYLGGAAALYFFQEKLIFRPQALSTDYKYEFPVPFRQVDLAVNKTKNLSIVQFLVPDSTRKGLLLYFHGNMHNINRYAPLAANFTSRGYETWMIDYPGFGKSTGKISEEILYNDAKLLYKMGASGFSGDSIVIYGRSIGTGIAAHLAMNRECRQLILETPYFSFGSLARHYFPVYPVRAFSKYSFPVNQYLQLIRAPVTIIHGTEDEVIPFSQARKLKELGLGNVQLITIEGGEHNNLDGYTQYQRALDSLLGEPAK